MKACKQFKFILTLLVQKTLGYCKMKLTKIYTYKNVLAYILLFSFINIINYIPDHAFVDPPVECYQSHYFNSESCEDDDTMPTSIVEMVFEDFFQFPESKFSFEELNDFSTNTNRYATIAKSIEAPPFSILPCFLISSILPYEQLTNNLSTPCSQFINTVLHAGYVHFLHLLYPF